MNIRRSRSWVAVSMVLPLTVASGCVAPLGVRTHVTIPKDVGTRNLEVQEKIPLRAGLYCTPALKNASFTGARAWASMGEALCFGSERVARNIFGHFVLVEDTAADLSKKNVDVVVTPELIEVRPRTDKEAFVMNVVMNWNIASTDGKQIYSTRITGEGTPKVVVAWTQSQLEENFVNSLIPAIQDQFTKAQEDLYSSGWWKNRWWK